MSRKKRVRSTNKEINNTVYALYKGDDFIFLGTIPEIAQHQGISLVTVRVLMSESYKKKCESRPGTDYQILIKVEEDDDIYDKEIC